MPVPLDILDKLRKNDPSLVHLNISSNVTLHFSQSEHAYIALRGDENERLTDVDMLQLCEALTNNTCLKSLNLNKNRVGSLGIAALATTKLEGLSISQNGLNSDCIDALMLSKTLTSLDVSGNILTDADIEKLARQSRLTSVDVSYNIVGPLSMTAFGLNTTLTKLSIKETGFVRRGQRYIDLSPLRFNTTLKCLELCRNPITTLEALSGHPELEALNLEECSIGTNDVDDIRPISQIPKLSWLSLRQTESRRRDTDHIAELLANLPLLYLDISETEMSALGAKALARSTTLITLIASKNYIGICGLIALAENKNITHLDISKNNFKSGVSSKPEIRRRNYQEIPDYILNFPDEINVALMKAFEQNMTLRVLNMSNMHNPYNAYITDERLASFIKNNTTVLTLDISHFAYAVTTLVLDGLAENRTIREITFTCNLERKENQNALAKNHNLTTIKCKNNQDYKAVDQPYAQEIQERNKHIAMTLLILHALKPINGRARVIDNISLLHHIGSYLFPPQCIKKAHLRAHSIFNRSMMLLERPVKRMRIEETEVNNTASSSL